MCVHVSPGSFNAKLTDGRRAWEAYKRNKQSATEKRVASVKHRERARAWESGKYLIYSDIQAVAIWCQNVNECTRMIWASSCESTLIGDSEWIKYSYKHSLQCVHKHICINNKLLIFWTHTLAYSQAWRHEMVMWMRIWVHSKWLFICIACVARKHW